MKKSEHVRNRAIGSGNVNGANIVNPVNIFHVCNLMRSRAVC
jgi:hypothetical protein